MRDTSSVLCCISDVSALTQRGKALEAFQYTRTLQPSQYKETFTSNHVPELWG